MIIYNQKLAGYLMLHGFKLLSIEQNKDFKQFNIFKFDNTKDIKQCADKFKTRKV